MGEGGSSEIHQSGVRRGARGDEISARQNENQLTDVLKVGKEWRRKNYMHASLKLLTTQLLLTVRDNPILHFHRFLISV